MRTPEVHVAKDGTKTFKVKFRQGGKYTSETFRLRQDAVSFAIALDAGGVLAAREWLLAREKYADVMDFAEWFEVYVEQLTGVTPRTRADYRKLNTRYLADLQRLPLPLVTRSHVTGIVNRLEAEGRKPKTIKNLIHMLSSCMALAVDEGHIARNPCRRVRLPKDTDQVIEARFLKPEEFARLYDATPAHYRPLVAFLVGTGMRWSEATALAPRHVDLENGTVRVERAWKWAGAGKGWVIGAPKSAKSRRTVNAAVVALKAVHPLPASEYLFTTPSGLPVRHNNFYNRIWKPAVEKAGIAAEDKPVRIHDLRHTHASWLISDGQSLEAVQDQLGHESILTTRGTYGHLQPAIGVAVGKSASEALARALADRVDLGGAGPLALAGDAEQADG